MKVIIIAAGDGRRMGVKIKNIPKGLLDVNGKSILERQVSMFKKNGISDIFIITGPHKDFGLNEVSYINDADYEKHDVLGSLMAARNLISGDVLTSYSDILFEEDILHQMLNFKGDVGIPVDLDWKKAYVNRTLHPKFEADNVLIKEGRLVKIQKGITKCEKDEMIGEFLGPIKLSSNGSRIVVEKYNFLEKSHKGPFHEAPSLKKAYLTDILQELIDSKLQVTPIIISGKWCEVDTPQDLERARKLFH